MKEFLHHTIIDQHITSRLPGFLLIEKNHDSLITNRILDEGLKRFFAGFGEHVHIYDLDAYKFALLMPEILPKLNCISMLKEDDDFAFIEGTFYDYTLLENNKKNIISTDLASEILKIVRNENYSKLKDFNGRYSGFVFIKKTNKLVVITDSYGANRVFIYNDNKNFVVTNNIIAISTNPALHISVNEESIAQILHYEYPAYRQTEFNEIELVLPSDILIRQDKKNKVVKSFQKINRTPIQKDEDYIEELDYTIDKFFTSTESYLQEPMGIYLSKGKDSRLFLPFLERNQIPYIPLVFKEDTGVFDYPQVKKIAELLDKDLHVLENHTIDRNLAFMISMNTTFTSPWLALGKIANNYVTNALMGLYGESSSGKLCAYRNYGIKDLETSIKATILGNSKNITKEEADRWVPYYKKWDTDAAFRRIYADYPPVQITFDYDTYQDIDHRSFRNAIVILVKSQHFITPITPYMDKNVAQVYHNLPNSLLKSQLAHTIIAAKEKKTNVVKSTAFPVSLKNEKYLRSILVEIVKLNSKFKNILMASHKKKFKPYIDKDSFVPRSAYFKSIFPDSKPILIGNPRILTRIYNVDDYLYMTMEDNVLPYCKSPIVDFNDTNKQRVDTNNSSVNEKR